MINFKLKNILLCDSSCIGVRKIFEVKSCNILCSLLKLDGIYFNIMIKSFWMVMIKLYSIFIWIIVVFMVV